MRQLRKSRALALPFPRTLEDIADELRQALRPPGEKLFVWRPPHDPLDTIYRGERRPWCGNPDDESGFAIY